MKKIIKFIMLFVVVFIGAVSLASCGPQKEKRKVPLYVAVKSEKCEVPGYEEFYNFKEEMNRANLKDFIYFTTEIDGKGKVVEVKNFEIQHEVSEYIVRSKDETIEDLATGRSYDKIFDVIEKYSKRFEVEAKILSTASFKPFTVETDTEIITYYSERDIQCFDIYYTNKQQDMKKS